jgi:hypothetical protein
VLTVLLNPFTHLLTYSTFKLRFHIPPAPFTTLLDLEVVKAALDFGIGPQGGLPRQRGTEAVQKSKPKLTLADLQAEEEGVDVGDEDINEGKNDAETFLS